jgi:SAM-dependent methyltransferase
MSAPGEPRDPRLTFGNVVDVYDEIRPTYPVALFDEFFALLPSEPDVLEVGPGTGQATRDLLARGAVVHAVEISPSMARRLRSNLPSERLTVSVGDFETIDLAAESADAVFSASAYHWISPAAQLDRPASILRPGGVLAVVGLFQVDSPEDRGFYAAAQPIYARYGRADEAPPTEARTDVEPTIAQALIGSDPRFTDVVVHRWDWDQTYTAAEYRKLMLSFSDTNMMAAGDRMGLVDDMEAFIDSRFDGQVTRPLVVALTTARRASADDGTNPRARSVRRRKPPRSVRPA